MSLAEIKAGLDDLLLQHEKLSSQKSSVASKLSAGKLKPILGMSAAQAALNFALHPGWQRWMPTYRVGTLEDVDYYGHRGNVTLDDVRSHYQNLVINNKETLENVPIRYMNCDSMPFNPGDRVVVEFLSRDWDDPKIIGYEFWPQPCCSPGLVGSFQVIEIIDGNWYAKEADLTPFQNEGRVEVPYRNPVWRIVWQTRQMLKDEECCYCYQFSRGHVNAHGKLVGLPDSMYIPYDWFPHYYPSTLHIEFGCRPFLYEHEPDRYVWPTVYSTDQPCKCEHMPMWFEDGPREDESWEWHWLDDAEFYSKIYTW